MESIRYATDEDLATRLQADYTAICPRDQKLAEGTDGVIAATDRWFLTSHTVDFENQGVLPGHVVHLSKPQTVFRAPGEDLVVESTSPAGLRLRRKGQLPGVGQPPAPLEGLIGIEFLILTLSPQVLEASYDLERRFGLITPGSATGSKSLIDARELREAVILSVLQRQYLELSRENGPQRDTFAAKSSVLKTELNELLSRLTLHVQSPESGGASTSMTRFHTRISR